MDSKTYIANAIRTESVPAKLDIDQLTLHAVMEVMIQASKLADQVKRKLFYGKRMDNDVVVHAAGMIHNLSKYIAVCSEDDSTNDAKSPEDFAIQLEGAPERVKDIGLNNLNIRLLHAGLGVFSESGELIEALQKQYETGVIDMVNFGEEIGDSQYYMAIACSEIGADLDVIRGVNIEKLRKRYPLKFDANLAINRNIDAERMILENGSV